MSPEYRTVLEKILFAHYLHLDSWDGEKFRKDTDECLAWLLQPGDRRSLAYLQFEYLRGRDRDFPPFARAALGFGDDAAARAARWGAYGQLAERGIGAARARGGYGG